MKNILRLILVFLSLWGLHISNVCGQSSLPTHWSADPEVGYSGAMSVVTTIQIDGVQINSEEVELGAFFAGDNGCRGSERAFDWLGDGNYFVMLTVQGETGEAIYFKVYDHAAGKEYLADISLTFDDNGSYGTVLAPETTTASIISFALTIDGNITNGSLSAEPSGSVEPGVPITLTVHPDTGYELSAVSAYRTGDPATACTLTGSGVVDGSTYTFTMPAYGVTATAAFAPTQAQTDVEAAKSAVESYGYLIEQAAADTEDDLKNRLVTEINALLNAGTTGVAITADDVTVSDFTAAVAGVSDGRFSFTVALSKAGAGSVTTITLSGTITAKAAQTAPSAPTEAGRTATSIALNAVADAEYGKDGVNWQDDVLFEGLTPNTLYTFYARLKETATLAASPASTGTPITTDKTILGGTVTISGNALFGETLTAVTTALTSVPVADLGTLTYQWQRNGLAVSGATGVTYTLAEADVATVVAVTVTATNCEGSATSAATSAVGAAVITINTQPVATVTVTESRISGSLSVSASATGGAALGYRWYENTGATNTGGSPIGGATGSSFSIPADLTAAGSPYHYYCVVSATGGATDVTSGLATVTVNALTNAAAPIITAQPQDVTVNTGDPATLSVTAASPDGGDLSYRWYGNAANSNGGGTPIPGAESDTYSPPTAAAGTTYYYVEVTNTLATATGATTATVASATAAVTANAVYTVTVTGSGIGGSVSTDKPAAAAGETVALTVSPDYGYELNDVGVYGTGSPGTPVTIDGGGDSYSFIMPAYDVTISATFKKTQAQLDREAVEAAKAAIEGETYQVAQATANDAASVRAWLIDTLDALFGLSHDLELRSATSIDGEVTVTAVDPATEGTESNPSGVNGTFAFAVALNRGAGNATATFTGGVIIATPYSGTPPVGIADAGANNDSSLRTVFTSSGLQVRGLVPGEMFGIYDTSGRLQFNGKATAGEQLVPLRERGVYIVVSGNRRVKAVY